MIELLYKKQDLRYIFFTGDDTELRKIEKHFNPTPSYMFLPSFRGVPKPEVFFHKFKSSAGQTIYYCHSGLWKTIYDWCNTNNISVQLPSDFDYFKYTDFNISLNEFKEVVDSWGLSLTPRPYQYKAAWFILKYRQSLSQLATRAGKTLISYIVFRYLKEHGARKILMIVPSVYLVKQACEDYKEYKDFFNIETVWSNGELIEGSNLTIGTFQSLVRKADKRSKNYDPRFFNDYDIVLVDEAHTLKCQSIDTILNQNFMKNIKLKFGFSGSLPDEHTIDSFCCHSLMGPMIQDIKSKELMDGGYITPVEITQMRINHPMTEELKRDYIRCGEYLNSNSIIENHIDSKGKLVKTKKLLPVDEREFTMIECKELPLVLDTMKNDPEKTEQEYLDYLIDLCKARGSNLLLLEQMLVHRDKKRLDLLENLLKEFNKNSIIYFHHTEYGRFLYKYFKEKFPNRHIYYISGKTTVKARNKIIQNLVEDKDAILFASYGCCSTGITFKNLDYGIFAQSFKSQIINLQSVGRGLMLANDKEKFYLYDLVDEFPTEKLKTQGTAKIKIYKKQNFDYTIEKL